MAKIESAAEKPCLGQLLDVLVNSDRIKIYDGEKEKDPVIYTGYVACVVHEEKAIDRSRRVARIGLGVDIFRKEKPDGWNTFTHIPTLGEEVPVESISDFEFSDLEEIIYTRIFLEVEK